MVPRAAAIAKRFEFIFYRPKSGLVAITSLTVLLLDNSAGTDAWRPADSKL
jgi:hypothetical protein